MAQSTQLSSTPSIRSRGLPVGSRAPVRVPAASRNESVIGAAWPETPAMRVLPR